MSNVPKARQLLEEVLEQLADVQSTIDLALKLMRRHYIAKRGSVHAKRITPTIAKKVIAFRRANPDMLHREIGIHFGIDGGRVSEILRKVGTHVSTIEPQKESRRGQVRSNGTASSGRPTR